MKERKIEGRRERKRNDDEQGKRKYCITELPAITPVWKMSTLSVLCIHDL